MSGRVALHQSIRHAAKKAAERHLSVRRGTVLQAKPVQVQLHTYSEVLSQDNELTLSAWAQLYDHVVGIKQDDMVLVQQEASDWVLMDVVPISSPISTFDRWRSA